MANQEREPFVLDFPNGQRVEDILKKADADYSKAEIDTKMASKATMSDVQRETQNLQNQIQNETQNLQNQINEIVRAPESGGDVSAEVAQARVDADGVTHATLKARCDSDADKTTQLKEDLVTLRDDVKAGGLSVSETIKNANFGTPYKTDCFALSRDGSQIGKYIDDIATSVSGGSKIYLIDISGYDFISFRVFQSVSKGGSYILDSSKTCIAELLNETETTGTIVKYEIPENAKYLYYSCSKNLFNTGLEIFVEKSTKSTIDEKIINGNTAYNQINTDRKLRVSLDNLPTVTGTIQASGIWQGSEAYYQTALLTDVPFRIDIVANPNKNAYISFLKSIPEEVYAGLAVDFCESETGRNTVTAGNTATIDVPNDCVCVAITKYSSSDYTSYLPTFDGYYKSILGQIIDVKEDIEDIKKDINSTTSIGIEYMHSNQNRNLCLCATKTIITNNAIPFAKGYVFHKLANDDKSIYYGENFNDIKKVGNVGIYPSVCMVACSPTDGRLIFTKRNQRGSMYVWDGETTTELFASSVLKPMGWLYNSGVDFTIDADGNEICIFAEYTNTPGSYATDGYKVWRGVYPYTSESDWNIVFSQNYGTNPSTDITHFHQVRRDPYTNILYLTSGDDSALSKWWYSTDNGLNWTLLTTGQSSGYEEHICRCINFCFTKDYAYFATDKGTNHCLNRISRDTNGILEISSREKICDLPEGRATNSICYVDSPKGIFMYDRIDIGFTEYYDKGFDVQFWSIEDEKLYTLMHLDLTSNTWGGHRGKCYLNYTNSVQPYPAMGFSADTLCIFDIVSANVSEIGTVYYEVLNKTLRTLIH